MPHKLEREEAVAKKEEVVNGDDKQQRRMGWLEEKRKGREQKGGKNVKGKMRNKI